MHQSVIRFIFVIVIMISCTFRSKGQTPAMQEVLEKGTLPEQFEYIEAKTRIYESYRAIYEEVFQKIRRNAVDSLSKAKGRITDLSMLRGTLENRIDSLNKSLSSTREDLDAVSRTKNSISVLGIELNKITYNSIMWLIVAGLAIVLGIGYVTFKRGLKITNSTKKELSDLKAEYDDYRQKSREAREKMSMDHFKEIQRLKGG